MTTENPFSTPAELSIRIVCVRLTSIERVKAEHSESAEGVFQTTEMASNCAVGEEEKITHANSTSFNSAG
jgi:hypothetical protein